MLWGLGVLALLGFLAWHYRGPGEAAPGRAFGVLVIYALLFWLTLLKVWWTATKRPAVVVDERVLAYQPLHTFSPRRLALDQVLSCGLRPGTLSLRFVYRASETRAREFFLNLAVVDRRKEFFERLGEALARAGLESDPRVKGGWRRSGWED
jgi:hypothetical protein